jgi:membrane-bound lytic murein transglycosylase B
MIRLPIFLAFLIGALSACAGPASAGNSQEREATPYRGWDYIVSKLEADGISRSDLLATYANPKMPRFSFVPFSVQPRESRAMYSDFLRIGNIMTTAEFVRANWPDFVRAERQFGVPSEFIAAILFIETRLGKNTGSHPVLYRLSRVASVQSPGNVERNYLKLKRDDPDVQLEKVSARAAFLERTFYKEVLAVFEIGHRNDIDPLNISGSIAGAFGWPQFLPSTYLRFGVDADGSGHVSLYSRSDVIHSVANYLSHSGLNHRSSSAEIRNAIWAYNHSDAYVDTVIEFAAQLKSRIE